MTSGPGVPLDSGTGGGGVAIRTGAGSLPGPLTVVPRPLAGSTSIRVPSAGDSMVMRSGRTVNTRRLTCRVLPATTARRSISASMLPMSARISRAMIGVAAGSSARARASRSR